MLKSVYLILPLFFFLILISTADAFIPVENNETYAGSCNRFGGFACTNITETFYCYEVCADGSDNLLITRYNETFQDLTECDTGLTTTGNIDIRGLAIANSTHLVWKQRDNTFRLIAMNMSACSPSGQFGTHTSGWTWTGAGFYYNATETNATGWTYWGLLTDGKTNSTTQVKIDNPFWSLHDLNVVLPDQTDNSTVYTNTYVGLILEYVDGSYVQNYLSLEDTFGSNPINNATYFDMWKIDEQTTWIYWKGNNLYRANFSLMPSSSDLTFYAVSPISNNSVSENPPRLHVYINSTLNGSLVWSLDSAVIRTETFTGSTSPQNLYITPATSLALGQHNWSVVYNTSATNNWTTNTQYFMVIHVDFFDNPFLATSLAFGSIFGSSDSTASQDMLSLLLSLVISIVVIAVINKVSKADGITNLAIFFGTFIIMVLLFYNAGVLSGWIVLSVFGLLVGLGILASRGE